MMDVSDGLLRDATRLARSSGVVLDLEPLERSVPGDLDRLRDAAARMETDPAAWALTGGEDHGMLATFPAGAALPEEFRRLGTVRAADAGNPAGSVLVAGAPPAVTSLGWDHFRQ
ncbi:hypothetical protein [Georgenia sp. SUBG003]|uniref:hypothetical protein n=1 Tax=Georgenia sp. SUBG003 TaxID=1497974 RepID=UPI000A98C0D7